MTRDGWRLGSKGTRPAASEVVVVVCPASPFVFPYPSALPYSRVTPLGTGGRLAQTGRPGTGGIHKLDIIGARMVLWLQFFSSTLAVRLVLALWTLSP